MTVLGSNPTLPLIKFSLWLYYQKSYITLFFSLGIRTLTSYAVCQLYTLVDETREGKLSKVKKVDRSFKTYKRV